MLGAEYKDQDCSAARALEIIGERWSLLILRDAIFRGTTQFSAFQRSLGIATNILAKRLERFVASGLMTGPGTDGQYRLTVMGRDLAGVLVAMTAWGERWVEAGPVDFVEVGSSEEVAARLVRTRDGAEVNSANVAVRLRPGRTKRQAASAAPSS